MTSGFKPRIATCTFLVLGHPKPYSCSSSTQQIVPGQRSTTVQTRLNSRRSGGEQQKPGREPTDSAHHEHASLVALVHPSLPHRGRKGCWAYEHLPNTEQNYQRKTFYFQVSMEILQTCRLKRTFKIFSNYLALK